MAALMVADNNVADDDGWGSTADDGVVDGDGGPPVRWGGGDGREWERWEQERDIEGGGIPDRRLCRGGEDGGNA